MYACRTVLRHRALAVASVPYRLCDAFPGLSGGILGLCWQIDELSVDLYMLSPLTAA
jgi:hypothetical protein